MLTRVVKLAEEDGWIQVAIIADGMQLQSLSKRIERVGFGDEADAKVLACSFGPRDTKKYVALINALVSTGRGHQYLDPVDVEATI